MPATKRPGAKTFSGSKAFLTRRISAASFLAGPQTFTTRFKSVGQKRMHGEPIVLSPRSSDCRAKYNGPNELAKIQYGIEKDAARALRSETSGGKPGTKLILKMVAARPERDSS